jgi:hypothetical protein
VNYSFFELFLGASETLFSISAPEVTIGRLLGAPQLLVLFLCFKNNCLEFYNCKSHKDKLIAS